MKTVIVNAGNVKPNDVLLAKYGTVKRNTKVNSVLPNSFRHTSNKDKFVTLVVPDHGKFKVINLPHSQKIIVRRPKYNFTNRN